MFPHYWTYIDIIDTLTRNRKEKRWEIELGKWDCENERERERKERRNLEINNIADTSSLVSGIRLTE